MWPVHVSDNPVWCGNRRIRMRLYSYCTCLHEVALSSHQAICRSGYRFFQILQCRSCLSELRVGLLWAVSLVSCRKDNTILMISSSPTGKIRWHIKPTFCILSLTLAAASERPLTSHTAIKKHPLILFTNKTRVLTYGMISSWLRWDSNPEPSDP